MLGPTRDMGLCDYWISISKCRKMLISPYLSKIEGVSSYDQVTKLLPLSTPKDVLSRRFCHRNPVAHWFDLEYNVFHCKPMNRHNELQTYILKNYSRNFPKLPKTSTRSQCQLDFPTLPFEPMSFPLKLAPQNKNSTTAFAFSFSSLNCSHFSFSQYSDL